jgi:hypothetical protein
MHCPSCGNESSPDQNFCRQCGFDLGPVRELVAKGPDKAQRDRIILRHMFRWMTWGLLVVGLAIIMLAASRSFDLGRLFGLATSVLFLTGVGLATYGLLSAIGKGASLSGKKSGNSPPDELQKASTTRKLSDAGVPIPVPSVTERTTQLIANERKSHESANN